MVGQIIVGNSMNTDKKEILGWAFYDFANSAFATTILAVIFNVYFATIIVGKNGVEIFGLKLTGTTLWAYSVSVSMFIVAVMAPILGVVADYSGSKKKFLFFYCYLGCLTTSFLFFLKEGDYILGCILFIIANIGFAGGLSFYNAFLCKITTKENYGKVSGLGWALGYIGGGLCLLLNLFIIRKPEIFGIPQTDNLPVRFCLLSVGVWWAVFAIPTFLWVREKKKTEQKIEYIKISLRKLSETFRKIKDYRGLVKFLLAYLIYNDGIETVIVMAGVFAATELLMSQSEIIGCFLLIQFVAFFGSLLFGYIGDRIGLKRSLNITLIVWCLSVLWAYFIREKVEFWILGVVIGLVLGGSQALSRALFGSFTPREREAEFFGFYTISGKFSAILGPLIYGTIILITKTERMAIFSLLLLFIIGISILYFVDEKSQYEKL